MLLANGQTLSAPAMAELSPQMQDSYYYAPAVGMQLERQFSLYGGIYKNQPWVRTVIAKRAQALARLPVKCMFTSGDTETEESDTGYAKLLADPCEYLDPFAFWEWVASTLDIYGETYLAIQKNKSGTPEKLMPMHPSRVAIKRNSRTGRYEYYFQAGAGVGTQLVSFADDEVVPIRFFNPDGLERGLSLMESLKSTIFSEDSSRNATAAMWKNAGRPNLVLRHEKRLSPEAQQRLREQFDRAHAGSSNTGKTMVVEEGMEPIPLQLTAVEMQFIEARQLNREEVCGVYDIAPPIVHILDRATFSNISAQMRAFYRDTMAIPIARIQSAMDKYVGQYWVRKNRMKFDIDDVIQPDWEAKSESTQKMVNSGVATPNEGREIMGLPRSDDPKADELYANSALQPLGATPDGAVEGEEAPAPKRPASTPVASLDQSPPTSVPGLSPTNSDRSTDSRKTEPRRLMQKPPPKESSPKHLRAVKGAMGRGKDIKGFALQLAEKYPDDLEDILLAVQLALAERKDN
uniref:Portal protein n=1 Tax=Mycobacterium Phage Xandras TaxID=3158891 RepID=A0AAU8GM75_9CAUD